MLRCNEVAAIVGSGELDEAGWRRRLSVRLHLMMCRHCRRYARQIAALGELTRKLVGREAETRDELERRILESIPSSGTQDRG
jgi:predicted anti-sigma-YlaC factor YlaD